MLLVSKLDKSLRRLHKEDILSCVKNGQPSYVIGHPALAKHFVFVCGRPELHGEGTLTTYMTVYQARLLVAIDSSRLVGFNVDGRDWLGVKLDRPSLTPSLDFWSIVAKRWLLTWD